MSNPRRGTPSCGFPGTAYAGITLFPATVGEHTFAPPARSETSPEERQEIARRQLLDFVNNVRTIAIERICAAAPRPRRAPAC